MNTITVSRWQYGGPRTEEFAPGPTGQVLHTALHLIKQVQCTVLRTNYAGATLKCTGPTGQVLHTAQCSKPTLQVLHTALHLIIKQVLRNVQCSEPTLQVLH